MTWDVVLNKHCRKHSVCDEPSSVLLQQLCLVSDGCAPAESRNLQLPRDLLCVSRQVLEMEKMFSNKHC